MIDVPIKGGQIVGQENEPPARPILRHGHDVVEARHREEGTEDGEDIGIMGKECVNHNSCHGAEPANGEDSVSTLRSTQAREADLQGTEDTMDTQEVSL